MHTKEINGETLLVHCSWRVSENCEDINNSMDDIVAEAERLNIKKISSGICAACILACFDEEL